MVSVRKNEYGVTVPFWTKETLDMCRQTHCYIMNLVTHLHYGELIFNFAFMCVCVCAYQCTLLQVCVIIWQVDSHYKHKHVHTLRAKIAHALWAGHNRGRVSYCQREI